MCMLSPISSDQSGIRGRWLAGTVQYSTEQYSAALLLLSASTRGLDWSELGPAKSQQPASQPANQPASERETQTTANALPFWGGCRHTLSAKKVHTRHPEPSLHHHNHNHTCHHNHSHSRSRSHSYSHSHIYDSITTTSAPTTGLRLRPGLSFCLTRISFSTTTRGWIPFHTTPYHTTPHHTTMTSAHHVNQIAPNYLHSTMQPAKDDSFTFTVGKLDAGMVRVLFPFSRIHSLTDCCSPAGHSDRRPSLAHRVPLAPPPARCSIRKCRQH